MVSLSLSLEEARTRLTYVKERSSLSGGGWEWRARRADRETKYRLEEDGPASARITIRSIARLKTSRNLLRNSRIYDGLIIVAQVARDRPWKFARETRSRQNGSAFVHCARNLSSRCAPCAHPFIKTRRSHHTCTRRAVCIHRWVRVFCDKLGVRTRSCRTCELVLSAFQREVSYFSLN